MQEKTTDEVDRGADLLAKVLQFRAGPQLAARVATYAMDLERRTGKLSISDSIRSLILLGLEVAESQKGKQS
jgi:hypothetical protein